MKCYRCGIDYKLHGAKTPFFQTDCIRALQTALDAEVEKAQSAYNELCDELVVVTRERDRYAVIMASLQAKAAAIADRAEGETLANRDYKTY